MKQPLVELVVLDADCAATERIEKRREREEKLAFFLPSLSKKSGGIFLQNFFRLSRTKKRRRRRRQRKMTSSTNNVDVAAGVTAALVCAGVGFLAELVLAVWAYRKPGFSSLRVRGWIFG